MKPCIIFTPLFQVFSHTCIRFLEKELPPSLSVDDILVSRCNPWLPRALRSPVIVLVSGDVARVISADTKTTQGVGGGTFLFVGKRFNSAQFNTLKLTGVGFRIRIRQEQTPRDPSRVRSRVWVFQDRILQLGDGFLAEPPRLRVAPERHRSRRVVPHHSATGARRVAAALVCKAIRS